MKRLMIVMTLLCLGLQIQAQVLSFKVMGDEFSDEKTPVAATVIRDGIHRWEVGIVCFDPRHEPTLLIAGGYWCNDYSDIDIAITVNGEIKRYQTAGVATDDQRSVFAFPFELEGFTQDFKMGSKIAIRITDEGCDTDIIRFSLHGSAQMYEKVMNWER